MTAAPSRRDPLLSVLWAIGVYALGLAILLFVSRQTGPAADELAVLSAVDRSTELVKRIATRGFAELALPEHRGVLEPGLLVVIGAWSKLSLARTGVLDVLTAMRLPWLALGAFAPLSIYLMLGPSRGRGVALAGAALCLFLPRFTHAVVVLDEGAFVASVMCLTLAAHVRSLGPARPGAPGARRSLGWAAFGALVLGFGAAHSLGVLWVLPLLLLHSAWLRRRGLGRLLRRGSFPLPPLVLFAIPLAPLALLVSRPALWKTTPATIAGYLLAPLSPSVARVELGALVIDKLPVPADFAWLFAVNTLPLAVLLLALTGLGVAFHEHLARRFASGSLRPARDRHGLGVLCALGLFFSLLGPAFTPKVLTTFPPRVEVMLPFVALAAATGLGRLVTLTGSLRVGRAFAALTLGSLAAVTLARASTASASLGLFGVPRGAVRGDLSELAAFAPAIDALGKPSVTMTLPPQVSHESWRWLAESRRLATRVDVQPNGELVLGKGDVAGARVAQVKRDGSVLWTLTSGAR